VFIYLFINPHRQSENEKKTFNVHNSTVWTKWPTQGQNTYVAIVSEWGVS